MGYFRIFYYITYILNFILRLVKRHGKALLWFICIAVFLFICLYNPKSEAIFIGDYSYGDPNYALYNSYSNINIDFIKRLDNYSGSNKETFLNAIKNSGNSFYLYYAAFDGSAMLNGTTYNTQNLRVFIYSNNFYSSSSISPSLYDNYVGVSPVDIKNVHAVTYSLYYFNGAGDLILYSDSLTTSSYDVQIPSNFINYIDKYSYDYLFNSYSLEEIEILRDLDEKLSSVDETLQQQQEYLEQEPSSEDFSSSDLPTDSGVINPTENGLNSFFNSFYNGFIAEPNYAQHTIRVPIPFTRQKV